MTSIMSLVDSIKYLEQMQQPYVKYPQYSNYSPYFSLRRWKEMAFPYLLNKDETVNGYFATANYSPAIKDFFWLP